MEDHILETIRNMLEKKLGRKPEGADSMADLGIDSIQYVEIIVQLENALQIRVPEEKLAFDAFADVNEMARFMEGLCSNGREDRAKPILFELADVYMPALQRKAEVQNVELLLGQICCNRIAGIAYRNLIRNDGYISLPGGAMKVLETLYKKELEKSRIYQKHLTHLCEVLQHADFKYALLKGAYLNTLVYDAGMRTSNDIDILVAEEDISRCQCLLKEHGFVQGNYTEDEGIVEAARRDIIMSKMNYGETIPFVKLWEGEPLLIDLNFSIDFKPESETEIVKKLLLCTEEAVFQNCRFSMLNQVDFLIHLCCHLYKEATTFDWVRRRSDLQLYKFSDLNVMIHTAFDSIYTGKLIDRIRLLELQKECYYALYYTGQIYGRVWENKSYREVLRKIKPGNTDFMKQIVDPAENRTYCFREDFVEWFALPDRPAALGLSNDSKRV